MRKESASDKEALNQMDILNSDGKVLLNDVSLVIKIIGKRVHPVGNQGFS
jgi:hypothetical protein